MPPPQGLVKVSRAAADRNLVGDISNGSYGKDWYSERGGSQVNEGGWASGDDTWMRPDLAAQFEGLSQPTPAAGTSGGGAGGGGGPTSGSAYGGGGSGMTLDMGNSAYNVGSPSQANPMLGKRSPALEGLSLALQKPRNY